MQTADSQTPAATDALSVTVQITAPDVPEGAPNQRYYLPKGNSLRTRGNDLRPSVGRQSPPVEPSHGEPDVWAMPRNWSEAPFPLNHCHDDGSVGSKYTCPARNRRLRAGVTLTLRAYLPAATGSAA